MKMTTERILKLRKELTPEQFDGFARHALRVACGIATATEINVVQAMLKAVES